MYDSFSLFWYSWGMYLNSISRLYSKVRFGLNSNIHRICSCCGILKKKMDLQIHVRLFALTIFIPSCILELNLIMHENFLFLLKVAFGRKTTKILDFCFC